MVRTQLTPRKQPQQARAQATQEAVLMAAAHIIEQHGLPGFNTNAVAERAGVSIGSLYQYYPNKDALMAALIARQQRQLETAILDNLADARSTGLSEGIRILVRAAIDLQRRAPRLAAAIDYEESRLPVDDILAKASLGLDGALSDFLRHQIDNIDPARLQVLTRTIRCIARAVIDEFVDRPEPDFSTAEDEAVVALTGYLTQYQAP